MNQNLIEPHRPIKVYEIVVLCPFLVDAFNWISFGRFLTRFTTVARLSTAMQMFEHLYPLHGVELNFCRLMGTTSYSCHTVMARLIRIGRLP